MVDHGLAATQFGPTAHPEFWKQDYVTKGPVPSSLQCARCNTSMHAYQLALGDVELEIDECGQCHCLWFDRHEATVLRGLMKDSAVHAEAMNARKGTIKSYIFQLLTQFPLEVWNPVRHVPVLVYALLASLFGIYILELVYEAEFVARYEEFLFVPALVAAGTSVWTIVTAGFFHASWMHLLGNMWMLWIFGDNVEDKLRRRHFFGLYFGALLAGNLAHMAVEWGSPVPLLGASGAISGVMGAYLVLFPKVKVWAMIVVIRVKVRTFWYLGFWVGLQIFMVYTGAAGVAWFAHLGGFAFGVLYALAVRKRVVEGLTRPHAV